MGIYYHNKFGNFLVTRDPLFSILGYVIYLFLSPLFRVSSSLYFLFLHIYFINESYSFIKPNKRTKITSLSLKVIEILCVGRKRCVIFVYTHKHMNVRTFFLFYHTSTGRSSLLFIRYAKKKYLVINIKNHE